MKFKSWILGICVLFLAGYLTIYGAVFYSFPPMVAITYGVLGKGLPFGPPRDLVMRFALCCKDLGRKNADEYNTIPLLVNIGSSERDSKDLVGRAEDAIRRLVNDKEFSVNWFDPSTGTTAFHKAIMSYDPWAVELLLELGADPCIRISKTARHHQGQNALELTKSLTDENTTLSERDQRILSEMDLGPLKNTIPLLEKVSVNCK